MGTPKEPQLVKAFCGIIAPTKEHIEKSITLLHSALGEHDIISDIFPFSFTAYYNMEMGDGLLRTWVGFKNLIKPSKLVELKLTTNTIENKHCNDGRRTINLDPGYLTLSKVVLASTKDFSHRVYLSKGIYAELTLQYKNNLFTSLPWTYADYMCPQSTPFFTKLRELYHAQTIKPPKKQYIHTTKA